MSLRLLPPVVEAGSDGLELLLLPVFMPGDSSVLPDEPSEARIATLLLRSVERTVAKDLNGLACTASYCAATGGRNAGAVQSTLAESDGRDDARDAAGAVKPTKLNAMLQAETAAAVAVAPSLRSIF
eukprot:364469-Chlamydomonas_euryale.AAC.19